MAEPLVSDELWKVVEALLPKQEPNPKGGRPPIDDRQALTGIIFVLKSGIPWEMLPQEMGCGCGMTCWRRLRDWQATGVWERRQAGYQPAAGCQPAPQVANLPHRGLKCALLLMPRH